MRRVVAGLVLAMGLPTLALAQDITRSPRPQPNPLYAAAAPVAVAEGGAVVLTSPLPRHRPRELTERIAALVAASRAPGGTVRVVESAEVDLAQVPAPTRKEQRKKKRELASKAGSVCGVSAIKGKKIAPITSRVKSCGVPDAVAVTSVAGVRLSQTMTVDCSIAKALNSWVDDVAQPAFDGKLVELRIAAHYSCRGRNNVKGAKISEHGKGKAIDIAAFILSNGKAVTVADNYNQLLRRIYKAACPYFKTTLGPGSDGYHEDHFHFDTAARKSGRYCR